MVRLRKSLELEFPLEEVFSYMKDPEKLVEWVTFLTHVHVTSERKVGPDTCISCAMTFMGRKIAFDAVAGEYEENRLIAWRSREHSSFSMENRLEFSENHGKTIIDWMLEYRIDIPFFGKIGEAGFLNYFRHEMGRSLERVRREFSSRKALRRI